MRNYIYENAKKALLDQDNVKGMFNVYWDRKYKPYFHQYTYKYFIVNPSRKDEREDYIKYYKTILSKTDVDNLLQAIIYNQDNCFKKSNSDIDELHDWEVEQLEKHVAQFEIAVGKLLSMNDSIKPLQEFVCSKEEVIEYYLQRDIIIEKIGNIKTKTIEYRKLMWD